jgi:hypothetical protein
MFIGHFALGFAAKRAAPSVSLAVLFLAAQLADLMWPVLVAAGVEQVRIAPENTPFLRLDFVSFPYSHSLVFLLVWGMLFAAIYRAATGTSGAVVLLVALVVSHWLLDFLTHIPDMPLYPGGPKLGLGLWLSTGATLLVEIAMYGVGLGIYLRTTRSKDMYGRWGFGVLATLLFVAYLASLSGAPPSVEAIWISALAGSVLILALSWWADRHRGSYPQVAAVHPSGG